MDKLKNRIRAFTGSFAVMISPVLLGIVLKKVNLAGAGKYQGIRSLEVFIDFVQGWFPHLAAATLQVGILPFLCVMMSEPCASYIAPRLLAASKVLVFVSNILLIVLGCGILLLIHKEAWLVLSLCSIMAVSVIAFHIISWCNVGGAGDDNDTVYHSKLEHLLELAAGVTVMMFLVLEVVALEGLLRNSQGQAGLLMPQPLLAPAPSESPTAKGQETFLGSTLLISFIFSTVGAFLMNVWTTPYVCRNNDVFFLREDIDEENGVPRNVVVSTTKFVTVLSIILQALPITAVVILITLDVLPHAWKPAVWLPVLPPFIVLLVLLCDICSGTQPHQADEDQKPAPLELTKLAFTGFLAMAVPSVTNASVGIASILCVLFTAATVLLGLLWRLLTHEAKPSKAVLKAANHASLSAHTFISFAGVAFWVMAASANK